MAHNARNNYLQAEVQTATPQKLQLMLIEAAIKNVHRTKQFWTEQKFDLGLETLTRSQDIVAEILSSLDKESNPDIAKQLASIYLFIFRRLAESGMSHDEVKLDDALRVLNSERETWRQVCEKFGASTDKNGKAPSASNGDSVSLQSSTKVLVPPAKPAGIQTSKFTPRQATAPVQASGNSWDV
jgi:flagellar protein FliS